MDLRPERQSDRRAVPARRRRQGRHAGGFQPGRARPARSSTSPPTAASCSPPIATTWSRLPTISAPRCCASSRRRSTAASCTVLGHYRHSLPGNWKLYHENLKDPYHATLAAHVPGDVRPAGRRQPLADADRRERAARRDGVGEVGAKKVSGDAKKEMRAYKEGMTLREPRFMDFVEEFDSPWSVTMSTIWPNLIVQREMNTLGIRQIVPTGPARVHHEMDDVRLRGRRRGDDAAIGCARAT